MDAEIIAIIYDREVVSQDDYNKLVAAIDNLVRACGGDGIERLGKMQDEVVADTDSTIRLEGEKAFYRCSCGCNVFRRIIKPEHPKRYKCNSCGATYTVEGD